VNICCLSLRFLRLLSLSLAQTKKKAIAELPRAHDGSWITSVACLPYTDVFASGASDGHLRVWQAVTPAAGTGPSAASSARASLRSLGTVPIPGFVNSLAFARSGQFLLAGVGQEHRCGRWQRIPEARNGVHLVRLPHA
jgi:ribosomal RNA-processing protein 9